MYSSGTCNCGLISISIDMKPFLTYNCHCSHCRTFGTKYLSNPNGVLYYHSACCVFQWNICISNKNKIEYEHTTTLYGLFALNRGRCTQCKQPIIEYGERCIIPFAMIMIDNLLLVQPNNIIPTIDLFYNSGPLYNNNSNTSIDNKKDSNNQQCKLQLQPSCSTIQRIIQTDIGSLLYEIYIIITVAIPLLPWSIYKRRTRTVTTTTTTSKQL